MVKRDFFGAPSCVQRLIFPIFQIEPAGSNCWAGFSLIFSHLIECNQVKLKLNQGVEYVKVDKWNFFTWLFVIYIETLSTLLFLINIIRKEEVHECCDIFCCWFVRRLICRNQLHWAGTRQEWMIPLVYSPITLTAFWTFACWGEIMLLTVSPGWPARGFLV